MGKLSAERRAQIERQIEQIGCFLDACYDGEAHDVQISWRHGAGFDPVAKRESGKHLYQYLPSSEWSRERCKFTTIDVGFGSAYYGDTRLGRILHEAAYEWREKLLVQLEDDSPTAPERTYVDLVK